MEYWHAILIVCIWIVCLCFAYPYLCLYTFCFGGDTPMYNDGRVVYECIIKECTGDIVIREVVSHWVDGEHHWILPNGYQVLKYRIV